MPKRPQALQGYAHLRTWVGAASMGLHCVGKKAMAVGSTVCGQLVPRSLSVSCRVLVPAKMVDTSYRSSGRIQLVVCGPTVWLALLMPTAVGISMYTDGDVKV
jgi:hypothetical protein